MDKITEQYLKGFFIFSIQLGRYCTLARFSYTPARNSEVGAKAAVKSKISIDLPNSIIIAETEKLKKP